MAQACKTVIQAITTISVVSAAIGFWAGKLGDLPTHPTAITPAAWDAQLRLRNTLPTCAAPLSSRPAQEAEPAAPLAALLILLAWFAASLFAYQLAAFISSSQARATLSYVCNVGLAAIATQVHHKLLALCFNIAVYLIVDSAPSDTTPTARFWNADKLQQLERLRMAYVKLLLPEYYRTVNLFSKRLGLLEDIKKQLVQAVNTTHTRMKGSEAKIEKLEHDIKAAKGLIERMLRDQQHGQEQEEEEALGTEPTPGPSSQQQAPLPEHASDEQQQQSPQSSKKKTKKAKGKGKK